MKTFATTLIASAVTLAAVSAQAQVGYGGRNAAPAHSAPQANYATPAYNRAPVYGQSQYSQSQYGQSQYGQSQYGQSQTPAGTRVECSGGVCRLVPANPAIGSNCGPGGCPVDGCSDGHCATGACANGVCSTGACANGVCSPDCCPDGVCATGACASGNCGPRGCWTPPVAGTGRGQYGSAAFASQPVGYQPSNYRSQAAYDSRGVASQGRVAQPRVATQTNRGDYGADPFQLGRLGVAAQTPAATIAGRTRSNW